jgi:membrane protein implicated in regulation of membrane protease activity
MNWPEIYLVCFGIGTLWSLVSLFLGGMHVGHAHGGHVHASHGHAHAHASQPGWASWVGALLTPGCIAIFLAWFGGIGYLLTRHSALGSWADLAIAILVGLAGAVLLGAFLRWLQAHEQPLESTYTDVVGMLGRVSSTIRPDGVGEVIYVRDGSRRCVPARSEDSQEIQREEEVVVTRYEKGIAFVRTWAAMTQPAADAAQPESAKGPDAGRQTVSGLARPSGGALDPGPSCACSPKDPAKGDLKNVE